ncbi:unnamed protein product [Mytilus coruscus]|uniref:Protein-tyrosine-phosphatase n=1 Tax=Mytilus coruscus TaxID=42192 RepID=A0A6J8B539_MYTCO|nr:unnamed protein product [Mytilus coruscus]
MMNILGPLWNTIPDFWTMIWQNNIRKIIMLINLVKTGMLRYATCFYWPDGEMPREFGNLILTLQSEKERPDYVSRQISIEDKMTKEKRTVYQYHFTAWPDNILPDPIYLALFHKHVMTDHSDVEKGKILVHCKAGIGLTGMYIGLDALYEEGCVTGCVDIVKFVKKMRQSRKNMVHIPSYPKFVQYLTTQLPLPDTKIDFRNMVWNRHSSTIVMFINEPTEAELVYAAKDHTFSCGYFTMKITRRENEEYDITDYPKLSVLCKLMNMKSTRVSMSHNAVTVVSCDGAKNYGLFCTFSNAVFSMTIDDNADIYLLTRLIQLRRPEVLAHFEEYRLCYEALNFYLESLNVKNNV